MMATRRRIERDRRRYNAIRRAMHTLPRPFPAYGVMLTAVLGHGALVFRGWARCRCGRPHQTIRLGVS